MLIKTIIAAMASFLIAAAFGRFYYPWLKKRGASQPLKEEVARIYEENNMNENDESSAIMYKNAADDEHV